MDSARVLFEELRNLKEAQGSRQTPEQMLIHYCTQVLGPVEHLHVDFKEKHDRSNGKLEDDDRKNLAKAISGFANSSGGVLIWGIENRTLSPKPITGIQFFISDLLNLATQATDPIVEGINGDWIPSDTESGSKGFGLILIPESLLPPHRVLLHFKDIKNHYYIRSGDSFVVASHTQLEDMFGRRPKPKLVLHTRIVKGIMPNSMHVVLGIENQGRGTAKSPFLSIKVHQPGKIYEYGLDGNRNFGLKEITSSRNSDEKKYGSWADLVIHPGVVHEVTVISIPIDQLRKIDSGSQDLVIDYKIAAEGIQLIEGKEIVENGRLIEEAKP